MRVNIQKIQKCQPAASDTPDLIQTECVADSGLARQNTKKSTERKKYEKSKMDGSAWMKNRTVLSGKPRSNIINTALHWFTKHNIVCLLLLSKISSPATPPTPSTTAQESWHSSLHYTSCASSHMAVRYDFLNWQNQRFTIHNHHINSQILQKIHFTAPKTMNKMIKSINGNRQYLNKMKIIHWNLGSRAWMNKLVEVEALLTERKPDICIISESNLWAYTPIEDRQIPGHKIILPDTMTSMGHARVVMIVRNELDVQLLPEYMDTETSSIWIKIGSGKKNSWVIGGIYREHVILGRGDTHLPWAEKQRLQDWRWSRIIRNWELASRNQRCIVIGDLNLDHHKWQNPEASP